MVYSHWFGPEPGPGPERKGCMVLRRTGFPLFYPVKFPDFPPDLLRVFPDSFLVFTKIFSSKKTYFFFLNVTLVTLVYANSAISLQLLRFNSLKKHFPQIYRFKRFKNGLEKKFPDLKFFSLILAEKPVFPRFPWLEKVFKIFPEFPDRWEPWRTFHTAPEKGQGRTPGTFSGPEEWVPDPFFRSWKCSRW